MEELESVIMLNAIGALCTAILAFGLFQIPHCELDSEKRSLRYFRLAVCTLAVAFSLGSVQVIAGDFLELRKVSIVLANLCYVSSYFFVFVAVSHRYVGFSNGITSIYYFVLMAVTSVIAISLFDHFVLRNMIMPIMHVLLLLGCIYVRQKSDRRFHQGDNFLKVCLYILIANAVITNLILVQLTAPGISTSLRVLLFILLNGIVLTSAIYALFLNDAIEDTRQEGLLDPLSGAYNRRLFNQLTARPDGSLMGSVVICDIDNFKSINDMYGHAAGDEAIVHFANLLKSAVRPTDTVVRLGGEEFLLVLKDTDIQQAVIIAKRVCQKTSEMTISTGNNHLKITASFGVSPIAKQGLADAVNDADNLLYKAKSSGKNKVIFPAELLPKITEH